jgi:heme A synthase
VATAHQKLAVAIVFLALGGTLWSGYLAYKGQMSDRLRLLGGATVAVIGVQAILGAVLAVLGSRPFEALHFVYGPATLLALPIATWLARNRENRAEATVLCAGWLIVLALSLRAVGTGGGVG